MDMKKIPVRHIDSRCGDTAGFSIRNIEDLLAGKDMVHDYHRHGFFFMLLLEKGLGMHEIDFTAHEVCDRSVFFMRPGQVHRLELKAGSRGYLLEMGADFCTLQKDWTKLLLRAGRMNCYCPTASEFQKMAGLMDAVFEEYNAWAEDYKAVIRANIEILLISLGRQQDRPNAGKQQLYMNERLEAFLGLLDKHITSDKRVSQYAALMHLSVYQLNAITSTTLGKTAAQLINEQLILEAKRYLLVTSDQVAHIAAHLGYEDASYFIRFFKKHTGISPEKFRKNFN